MAKQQQPQRRPQQPQQQAAQQPPRKAPVAPVRAKEKRESIFSTGSRELVYGRQNFIWFGIGLALVIAGLVAMSGGSMPSPDVWDEGIIYSFTRITLAPIMMVAGFIVVAIGIFKRNNTAVPAENAEAEA